MKFLRDHFLLLALLICSAAQAQFDNVLLIINYNFAYYESVPTLKKIYEPYFKHIVFYGPEEHPDVHLCVHDRGYLSYTAIADAMMRYPEFDGYLFLHDDCILNAWHLKDLDLSQIWMPSIGFLYKDRGNPINITNKNYKWSWWQTEWGYAALNRSYKQLPDSYKEQLVRNWGHSNVVAMYSDLAYVPACYKEQFIELSTIFAQNNAFLEVALPTIISCLAPKSTWQWLRGGGTVRDKPMAETYKTNVFFNHPVKLSLPENRLFIENIFTSIAH